MVNNSNGLMKLLVEEPKIIGHIDQVEGRGKCENRKNSYIHAPSNERIKKLENYSNVIYPESFLEFIKHYNGGIPITNKFLVNGKENVLERFLCISENPKESDLGEYDIAVVLSQIDDRLTDNPELIGDELIPIATAFGGDFICLDFRENMIPTVSLWLHEESDTFYPAIIYVSANFESFLEMLKE
ncbi:MULTISPECIES: SMI1/KNR4 family protein [Sporosarcina]|uniref:SMI1/KNR4 family protein n=1 Tax=Sporosarcina TaxID=1569 RepID=UPI0030CC2C7B